jgi:hypothetical protein
MRASIWRRLPPLEKVDHLMEWGHSRLDITRATAWARMEDVCCERSDRGALALLLNLYIMSGLGNNKQGKTLLKARAERNVTLIGEET